MTYNVFGGSLYLTQPTNLCVTAEHFCRLLLAVFVSTCVAVFNRLNYTERLILING